MGIPRVVLGAWAVLAQRSSCRTVSTVNSFPYRSARDLTDSWERTLEAIWCVRSGLAVILYRTRSASESRP